MRIAHAAAICRAIGCADTRAVAVRPHGPVGAAYARSAYGRRTHTPDGDNVAELYFPIE